MDHEASNSLSKYFPVKKSRKIHTSKAKDIKPQSTKGKVCKDLDDNEKLLLEFDLNYDYGPSQDMTRLERWERAMKLNLNPPQRIKDLILSDQENYLHPVWSKHPILS